jgi:membrane protease YdiL (CAAX protease family)
MYKLLMSLKACSIGEELRHQIGSLAGMQMVIVLGDTRKPYKASIRQLTGWYPGHTGEQPTRRLMRGEVPPTRYAASTGQPGRYYPTAKGSFMDTTPSYSELAAQGVDDIRRQARRGLTLFFAVLVPFSVVLYGLAIQNPSPLWFFLLMWTPAVASLVARLALREGIADVSFRLSGRRGATAMAIALVFPAIVGGAAYGFAWVTGLANFVVPPAHPLITMLTGGSDSSALQFSALLLLTMTLGLLGSGISALGEEIGWRGYMLTRLIDANVPAPVLASGLIWGLWHIPLILAGQYVAGPSVMVSALLFLVVVIAVSVVFAWLRFASGSVWPAVVLHASWNSVIQGAFDQASAGTGATLWIGESGILVAIIMVGIALIIARRTGSIVRPLPPRGANGPAV